MIKIILFSIDDFINDLYDEDILDDNEINIIQNNKNIEKDDFER